MLTLTHFQQRKKEKMQYRSDVSTNRSLVRSVMLNPENPREYKELFLPDIQHGKKVIEEATYMSYDKDGRRDLLSYVNNNATAIATWKATLNDLITWQDFLIVLTENKVSIRTITAIKQVVDYHFSIMLEDAILDTTEDAKESLLVIDNVRSFVTKQGKKGLILEIELFPAP